MTCRIVQALHSRTPRAHKPCKTLHGTYIYVLNVFMHHSEHSPWISSMPSHRPPCRVKCTRSHSPDATTPSHPPSTHITNFTPPPHRHPRHMPGPTLRKPRVPHAHRTPRHVHMHAMHPHNVPNTHPEHSPVQEHGVHLRVTCYQMLSAAPPPPDTCPVPLYRHMPDPTLRKPHTQHAHRTPRHMHMHAMHPHNVPNTHPEHSPVQEHGVHLRVTCYQMLSAAPPPPDTCPVPLYRHMPDPTLRKPHTQHAHRTPRHMHMHAMHPHNVPNTHPEHLCTPDDA